MKHVLSKENPNLNTGLNAVMNYSPDTTKVTLTIYDDELDKVTRKTYEVNK